MVLKIYILLFRKETTFKCLCWDEVTVTSMEHSFILLSKDKTLKLQMQKCPQVWTLDTLHDGDKCVHIHIQVGMLPLFSRTECLHILLLNNMEYKGTISV